MGAFHAYDIRGIYMKDLFPENVYKYGLLSAGVSLKTGRIAVGRDCRESSPEVFESW